MKIGAPHVAKFDRWTPRQLMNGSLALWYDFTDQFTLYTDTARTARVNALTDAIAAVEDKSGNGGHLTQATAANRPLWNSQSGVNGALFDGTNDGLSTTSGNAVQIFRNQSAAAIFALIYPTIVTSPRTIASASNDAGTSVRTLFQLNPSGSSNLGVRGRRQDADSSANFVTGVSSVENTMQTVGFVWDTSNATYLLYTNGNVVGSGSFSTAGLFSDTNSAVVSIGSNQGAAELFPGTIFEVMFLRGANHTHMNLIENYFRRKAGL